MSSRWLLSLAVLLILAPSAVADAAILIDARKQGDALRLVIDADQQRALIVTPRGQSVVDLERDRIYAAPGRRARRSPSSEAPRHWAPIGSRRGGPVRSSPVTPRSTT